MKKYIQLTKTFEWAQLYLNTEPTVGEGVTKTNNCANERNICNGNTVDIICKQI